LVAGATVARVVPGDASLVPGFIAAGRRLAEEGCSGIVTTCGFLVRHQSALAAALPVPVATSALLQLPLVERTLPRGRRAGVVTFSASDLDVEALAAAGASADTPIAGLRADGHLATVIRNGAATLDIARARDETVDAARRLVASHRDVGAIVLECANLPPYRDAVRAATGLPVFDAAGFAHWLHAALATGTAGRARSRPPD
jgi:Asp/Glu/hydantoin racemase